MITQSQAAARDKWLAFIAVSVGVFMSTLDSSIVNIGLPTIQTELKTNLPTVQWVVMSYLLSITSVLLTLGRLGDLIGRKKLYQIGVMIFLTGSVFCGFAPGILFLILSRALQGLGASMIMAMGPAITTSSFPANERGRALGMIGTVVATGLTFGPALGGYILKYLGWRWMFFVNVPVGLIGLPMIHWLLKENEAHRKEKFDVPGAVLLFLSLTGLLLALSHGQEWGWSSRLTLSLFAGFIVFGSLFFWWESRVDNPVFHLELFHNRLFTSASVAAWISFVALFAVSVFMPFYLRQVLELSAVRAGQLLMLVPLSISFIAPLSGWMSDKIGSRTPAVIGLSIATVGLLALSRLGLNEPLWDVAWRLLLTGIGSGIFQSPNTSAIMGSVPRNMLGVASGMVAMMRNFGMVAGVAVIGAVVSFQQARYLSSAGDITNQTSKAALVSGLHLGFTVAAGICALGIVVSMARGGEGRHEA